SKLSSSITVLCAALVAASAAAQPRAPSVLLPTADEPLVLESGRTRFRVVLVTDGLVGPWDLEFLPDGETMLVTEMHGQLRMVRDGKLLPEPLWTVPTVGGRDILHGVVAHPRFAENGFVYVSYTKSDEERGQTLAVLR